MESEDDRIPFLKYCNENPGNYLIQNGYELHDTLPGESILTEIGTPGTWHTECCPISGNTFPLIGNVTSAICRCDHDKNILQPAVLKDLNLNDDAKISQHTSKKELISKSSDVVLKFAANSSEELQNVFSHIATTNQNNDTVSQHNDYTNNILFHTNGTNYSVKCSLNSLKQLPNSVKANFEVKQGKSLIKKNILQILSSDVEIEKYNQHNDTGQDYFLPPKQCEDHSDSDTDPSLWQDFYSILTAMKCKVCSFLCERTEEMIDHMKEKHKGLMILKQTPQGEIGNLTSKKMKSLLNTNQPSENENDNILTLFTCSYCNKLFSTREILLDHITKVHSGLLSLEKNGIIKTNSLNATPNTAMRTLSTALLEKQKRGMSKVRCSVTGCCLKFASNEIKALHEECHVSDKQLQCPLCKEKFSIWRLCSKHLWTSHNIDAGLYTCPICNKYKSNSPVVVMNHMDIHNIERPFICTECGKGFKQLNQLRNHALIHKKEDKISAWSLSRKCTICERYFANPKSLKIHIQSVHEKSKPYVCNICGHKTSRKAMLELHLRQHTGDKPYHCSHCTYKTGDHNCLRRHLMWHYGCMKYFCPHCKYKSIQSSAFKKHLENRHPEAEVTFKCNICPFTTVNSDSYLTHVKIHEVTEKGENGLCSPTSINQQTTRENNYLLEKSTKTGNENYIQGDDENYMQDDDENYIQDGDENYIQDDGETFISLHITDNGDHSEEMISSELVTIPAGFEIQLAH